MSICYVFDEKVVCTPQTSPPVARRERQRSRPARSDPDPVSAPESGSAGSNTFRDGPLAC